MKKKRNILIQKIVDALEEARIKYNIAKEDLDKNGAIVYANANDGTEFDWTMNERLCEFGYGVKDKDVWAFKLLLNTEGDCTIYCYPNGELKPIETIKRNLMSAVEAECLKNIMMNAADDEAKWNCTLEELGL